MPLLSTRGAASARGFGLLGRVKALADPFFNYVTMLLHGDGTNGAQNNTFLDSSTNNFTITRNGNTTQGSFSPYGPNWSNYFNGSTDRLRITNTIALNLGAGDFTVECWWFSDKALTAYDVQFAQLLGKGNGTQTGSWALAVYQSKIYFGTSAIAIQGSINVTANTWNHYAVTRSGTTVRTFVNGVLDASGSSSQDITNTVQTFAIGDRPPSDPSGQYPFNGYISNVRTVVGAALYTSSFTPSTTPLTAISGTSLLTCADNRFIDDSTNNFGFTVNGTPSVQRFSPFAPPAAYSTATIGGSGYFDGNRDYLSAPTSAVFAFDTGDFTMEHWVYGGDQIDAYPRTFAIGPAFSTGSVGFTFDDSDFPNKVCFYARSVTVSRLLVSTSNVNDNAWHHVAVTRASGIFRMYVDGVLEATNSSFPSSSVGADPQPCIIAGVVSELSGEDFVGYLAGLRIVKGTVVYTSAFTPPAAPPTAVTNTSLLLNFTNGAIFDNAMMNDLETVGNAQISTSVVKFGTGSLAFDGTGDYLSAPSSPNLAFGTGNFTVECWAYAVSSTNNKGIWTTSPTYGLSETSQLSLVFNGANFFVATGGGTFSTSGITVTTGIWYYLALVKNGSTTTLYVNGVSRGSISDSLNYTDRFFTVGGYYNTLYLLNGYIDDLRITKGVARYTANFTPPTAAFPNQ